MVINQKGDSMKRLLTTLFIFLILAGTILVVGCTKTEYVYICANGMEVVAAEKCPSNKVAAIRKQEAETYARNYVTAYFTPYGGKAQFVSSYLNPDEGDYYSTFIVAERDGEPLQTVVVVDGITGQVACSEECEYIN